MPTLFVIAGCNGAGKTTASYTLLPEVLGITEFVNADEIARGLSPFNPESVAIQAGRLMLERIHDLIGKQVDFAIETTLANKSYVTLLENVKGLGYEVYLLYFWLSSPEMAVDRVATRVREGGHNIPIDTIRRRYHRGVRNLFRLYLPLADSWFLVDNSEQPFRVVAEGKAKEQRIFEQALYERIKQSADGNDT
ncbi:MAG TPA: zeta toxin family protein [Chitinophagales bacterium]|nr:zeta toxin family protein [Chitinophagales bacterium]